VEPQTVKTYRDGVDQATRDDIAAAAAVNRELGSDYEEAVAESLVDRIGEEIDKRIDAKVGGGSSRPRPQPRIPQSRIPQQQLSRAPSVLLGIGIGAVITGIAAMAANGGHGRLSETLQRELLRISI
jgi:hypothetical protein